MAAVYLLLHKTEARFKLGTSTDPQQRVLSLPEYANGELALDASYAIWVDSPDRALEIERSMHRLLRRSAYITMHRGDGHTEWFSSAALDHAIRLLGQVPLDRNASQFAPVQPLLSVRPELLMAEQFDDGAAQEGWLRVEDLLLRLARHLQVQVRGEAALVVRFRAVRQRWTAPPSRTLSAVQSGSAELCMLRRFAMDPETYHFRRLGQLHSFVQWFDYAGDDLVIQFTPFEVMRSWDLNTDLAHHVRALLNRLPLLCGDASRAKRVT